ncbi:MAG: hypothetical protein ACO331_16495 [Prochlorothrix sp.]
MCAGAIGPIEIAAIAQVRRLCRSLGRGTLKEILQLFPASNFPQPPILPVLTALKPPAQLSPLLSNPICFDALQYV